MTDSESKIITYFVMLFQEIRLSAKSIAQISVLKTVFFREVLFFKKKLSYITTLIVFNCLDQFVKKNSL